MKLDKALTKKSAPSKEIVGEQNEEQLNMLKFIINNHCSMEGHNIVHKEMFLKTFTITRKP